MTHIIIIRHHKILSADGYMILLYIAIGTVLFEERIGCFEHPPPQLAQDFIINLMGFFKYNQPLMYGFPLYKLFPTKTWKIYENYSDNVLRIGQTFVNKVSYVYINIRGHEHNLIYAAVSGLFLGIWNWGGRGIDKCLGGVNMREEQIYIEKD